MDALISTELTQEHLAGYVENLAQVNKAVDVVTTADIVNTRGVLVARKGLRVDMETARKVAQHKLAAPIEQSVEIANTFSQRRLLEEFNKLSDTAADVRQMHKTFKFDSDFALLLQHQPIDRSLLQKLTVFYHRRPQLLQQAIGGAWLAGLLARELDLPAGDAFAAVLAALIRDVGLLHLPAILLDKTAPYTPEEWRAMQSHTLVGKLLLKDLAVPENAARAVLEHHERYPGLGYPAGKEGKQLDTLGQIVGLSDTLCAIRFKRFAVSKRTLRDTQPYLRTHGSAFHPAVYAAAMALLARSDLAPHITNPVASAQEFATYLHARATGLQRAVNMLEHLPPALLEVHPHTGRCEREMIKTTALVLQMITRSGMVREELLAWLEHSVTHAQDSDVPELCELQLMQNELYWQLNQVKRTLDAFFVAEAHAAHPAWAALKRLSDQVWLHDLPPALD